MASTFVFKEIPEPDLDVFNELCQCQLIFFLTSSHSIWSSGSWDTVIKLQLKLL